MENLLSTVTSVSEIVDDFQSEYLAIPEIQRDVVWSADQTKDLIDSISQGYPCGALIYWEPREKDKQLVRSMIRPERLSAKGSRIPRYFLLDGQQRVTALASVLLQRERLRGSLWPKWQMILPAFFANLKRFPREFIKIAGSRWGTSSHGFSSTDYLTAPTGMNPHLASCRPTWPTMCKRMSNSFVTTSFPYRSLATAITRRWERSSLE